jgi:hypothetical protein
VLQFRAPIFPDNSIIRTRFAQIASPFAPKTPQNTFAAVLDPA